MRHLCITIDYEIFGDGSGDVRVHMLNPTERMARICEYFGMPLTIFFEAEEFLAFERERTPLIKYFGYDPVEEIRSQILDLIERGHDVQLHLHPEWVGGSFQNGRWILRTDHPTVDCLFKTQIEVSDYLGERKKLIDRMYASAGSKRSVTAFRCGAFCAQPGRKLLWALAENRIAIDSSLVKGMMRSDEHVHLDFSKAPDARRHWPVSEDVALEDKNGRVTEIPIYSRIGRRFQQLTLRRLQAKFSAKVPKERKIKMVNELGIGRTPLSVLRFLSQRFPIKLDFHNMSADQLLRWIRQAPAPPHGDLDVLVLIGHSKEHRDDDNFMRFLNAVDRDPDLGIISMDDMAKRILSTFHVNSSIGI